MTGRIENLSSPSVSHHPSNQSGSHVRKRHKTKKHRRPDPLGSKASINTADFKSMPDFGEKVESEDKASQSPFYNLSPLAPVISAEDWKNAENELINNPLCFKKLQEVKEAHRIMELNRAAQEQVNRTLKQESKNSFYYLFTVSKLVMASLEEKINARAAPDEETLIEKTSGLFKKKTVKKPSIPRFLISIIEPSIPPSFLNMQIKTLQQMEETQFQGLEQVFQINKNQFDRFKTLVKECEDDEATFDEDFCKTVLGYPQPAQRQGLAELSSKIKEMKRFEANDWKRLKWEVSGYVNKKEFKEVKKFIQDCQLDFKETNLEPITLPVKIPPEDIREMENLEEKDWEVLTKLIFINSVSIQQINYFRKFIKMCVDNPDQAAIWNYFGNRSFPKVKDLQVLEKNDWRKLKKGVCPDLSKRLFNRSF